MVLPLIRAAAENGITAWALGLLAAALVGHASVGFPATARGLDRA